MNRDGLSPNARSVLLERQCTATNRDGERCRRPPISGGFVCHFHGGKTPLAQRAARERLLMLVEPALEVLFRATRNAPPCPHCGRSDADRDPTAVRAAGMILDRTGFSPAVALTVIHDTPRADYAAWMPPERLELVAAWIAEARAAMRSGEPLPDVIDVEDAVDAEGDAHLATPVTEPGGD